MPYPTSRTETIADGAVHVAGLALAVPASLWLIHQAPVAAYPATAIYAACMVFAFAASALYHLLPFDRWRGLLGRVDHAAIYFKIAGTYTPFVVVMGLWLGYGVLALVWLLAAGGAVAKLFFWRLDGRGSLALYLGMGWLSVLLLWPMVQHLPGISVALVAIGGLTYSAGTLVYAHPGMRYQNAIWHAFVLGASICFFIAIALSLNAAV